MLGPVLQQWVRAIGDHPSPAQARMLVAYAESAVMTGRSDDACALLRWLQRVARLQADGGREQVTQAQAAAAGRESAADAASAAAAAANWSDVLAAVRQAAMVTSLRWHGVPLALAV